MALAQENGVPIEDGRRASLGVDFPALSEAIVCPQVCHFALSVETQMMALQAAPMA